MLESLPPIIDELRHVDERCTARMLIATATARAIDPHRGLEQLDEVYAEAKCAHPSLRGEAAYYQALALWTLRRYDEADLRAQQAETAGLDVLSVRATELRAYCKFAQGSLGAALDLFRLAHMRYERCNETDADLASKIIMQVANLEETLRGAKVAGTHATIGARRFRGDTFGASTPSASRMRTRQADGWLFALDGLPREAFSRMREAGDLAPTPAWRISALAHRALIAFHFGEPMSAEQNVASGLSEAQAVDWATLGGEERDVILELAEAACACGREDAASVLLETYDATAATSLHPLSARPTDAAFAALSLYVRGLVARSRNQPIVARDSLGRAYRMFRAAGCLWRATLALIELDATPAGAAPAADFHLEAAARLVQEHFPRSFLASRLGRWRAVYSDQIARKLSPALRQVLRYALDGYGAKEIAALTGRSVKTVGNQLTSLHEAFGVPSTLRLVAVCHARGIGSPAWRSGDGPERRFTAS